jgi:hypothetical protein
MLAWIPICVGMTSFLVQADKPMVNVMPAKTGTHASFRRGKRMMEAGALGARRA